MNARLRFQLTAEDAADLMYPLGWRTPPKDDIERQRAIEHREDQRRDDDFVERED